MIVKPKRTANLYETETGEINVYVSPNQRWECSIISDTYMVGRDNVILNLSKEEFEYVFEVVEEWKN